MDLPVGLNNRDLAVLFWTLVFFAWMVSRRDVRPALVGVLRSFAQPVILGTTLGLAFYSCVLVFLGGLIGIWETGLAKETVIWFLGTGFVLLMNMSRALDRDDWFQLEVKNALRVAVLIDFFINLVVLPLPIELILAPFLTGLLLMSAFGGSREDLSQAKGCVDSILGFLGIALFVYVGVRVFTDWSSYNDAATLESLLLPIWLTLAVLPYIYALAVWSGYQRTFGMVDRATDKRAARRRARLALMIGLGPRTRELGQFYLYPARQVGEAESFCDARNAVRDFRAGLAAERKAVRDEEEHLRKFAGVKGEDEDGRRLDQREFAETKGALQWIATSHMGSYDREDRYRKDLLEFLPIHELPEDHGIEMRVSEDGQRWFAWRRTVTGWCFAIGSAAPPPDQWSFDGADPPVDFPGIGSEWGDSFGIEAKNW